MVTRNRKRNRVKFEETHQEEKSEEAAKTVDQTQQSVGKSQITDKSRMLKFSNKTGLDTTASLGISGKETTVKPALEKSVDQEEKPKPKVAPFTITFKKAEPQKNTRLPFSMMPKKRFVEDQEESKDQ